jgi:hypothetical protein
VSEDHNREPQTFQLKMVSVHLSKHIEGHSIDELHTIMLHATFDLLQGGFNRKRFSSLTSYSPFIILTMTVT